MDIHEIVWTVAIIGCLIFGIAGAALLSRYEKAGTGFILGFLLGPIGLVIAWTMRDSQKHKEILEATGSSSLGSGKRGPDEGLLVNVAPDDQHGKLLPIDQLAARIRHLEGELADLKLGLCALYEQTTESEPEGGVLDADIYPPVIEPSVAHEPKYRAAMTVEADESGATESAKAALHRTETLIGGHWLTWIGGATMLLAIAFFIPWAWQYFEIPAWFKVLILHLASWVILWFGLWIARRDFLRLGYTVVGLGLFAWYGTALAALRTFDVYEKLFGDGRYAFAALECSLITLVAIVLAVRRRSLVIILLAAFGGYLNPTLTSSGEANLVILFVYLAFLNVGLIASAVLRGWNFLKLLALCATAGMFLTWIIDTSFASIEQSSVIAVWPLEWLAVLHAVIFFLGVTLPPIVWRKKSCTTDLMTLVGTSTGYMALTYYLFETSAQSQMGLLAGGLGLLHAVLFSLTRQRVGDEDRLPRVHLALTIFFLTLIAPLQLENLDYLSVAWAMEGVVLMGIGLYYRDRQFLVSSVIVFVLTACRFLFQVYESEAKSLQPLLVMLTLLGGSLAWWLPRRVMDAEAEGLRRVRPTVFETITGGLVLGLGNTLLMITIVVHTGIVWMQDWNTSSGRTVLLLWTLDLLIVWMVGFLFDRRAVRIYAALAVWLPVSVCTLVVDNSVQNPFTPLFNSRFGSLALLTAVAFAIATGYGKLFASRAEDESQPRGPVRSLINSPVSEIFANIRMRYVMGLYGCLVLFAAINMDIANCFDVYWSQQSNAKLATYSIVWILFAVAIVIWGFVTKSLFYRTVGLLAFVPILLKVFFIDLSQLDQLARVLATFTLGSSLLGVSFLYQRIAARSLK